MTDALEKAITGEPVMVEIRGKLRGRKVHGKHPLIYPLHNLILYQQKTGDTLFERKAWDRIDVKQDPERFLACLWAGLHELQNDGTWKAPYTYEELGALVDFTNALEVTTKIGLALVAHFPKAEESDPKAQPDLGGPDSQPSNSSGAAVESATGSAA